VSYNNSRKTKSLKRSNKLLPFLQQDKLSNKFLVVLASIMNSILVLPCKFLDREFVVFSAQSMWDTIGWPDY
jgi:hypothetical protein